MRCRVEIDVNASGRSSFKCLILKGSEIICMCRSVCDGRHSDMLDVIERQFGALHPRDSFVLYEWMKHAN